MNIPNSFNQVDQWKSVMFLYDSALKEINTKIEILNNEFVHIYNYNPIEHIKSRLKTPDSIVKKLKRYGFEVTIDNMVEKLGDIAGIRIICSFLDDIYEVADMTIPIYLTDGPVDTKVEIQIRTIAMDFWASLEHKIYYKFEGNAPAYLQQELKACADVVNMLDVKMFSLNQAILELAEAQRMQDQEMPDDEEVAEEELP